MMGICEGKQKCMRDVVRLNDLKRKKGSFEIKKRAECDAGLKRAPKEWQEKEWEKKDKTKERVGLVMWCEKFSGSQLHSLLKCLMSHFVRHSGCFWFFRFMHYGGDSRRKCLRRAHESKVLNKILNPQPQKLMTCILAQRAQTKPSESGFISIGLS